MSLTRNQFSEKKCTIPTRELSSRIESALLMAIWLGESSEAVRLYGALELLADTDDGAGEERDAEASGAVLQSAAG